jgi:hypothetical protein
MDDAPTPRRRGQRRTATARAGGRRLIPHAQITADVVAGHASAAVVSAVGDRCTDMAHTLDAKVSRAKKKRTCAPAISQQSQLISLRSRLTRLLKV